MGGNTRVCIETLPIALGFLMNQKKSVVVVVIVD